MTEKIQRMLEEIERRQHVKIIYAVESGSRAWGFASPDSDYDVRYIFVRPVEDYLRIDPLPDTIEGPLDDVMDFSGWDIRKALFLLRKTNPSLMEWIQSPIVYRTTPQWQKLSEYFEDYFNPLSNMYHYMSMATAHWQKYLQDEKVRLKKYLYVLRPVLCCRYLEKYQSAPPVPFNRLCEAVLPADMKETVAKLLQRKMSADEAEKADHIPELDAFLLAEMKRLQQALDAMERTELPGYEGLNQMLFNLVREMQ